MRSWAWLLVAVVAATLAIGLAGMPRHDVADAPVHTGVGAAYLVRAEDETGMPNVVTAVLLNYRGFDTFVEVVVIFTALAAVLALPAGGGGTDRPPGDGGVATDAARRAAVRTSVPVSPVVFFVVRSLAPFIALFALATLYRGHSSPGGGFQAGALLGALFVVLGLVLGRARVERLVPVGARAWLQAAAPLAFALVAAIGWALTGAFLGFPQEASLHAVREAMGMGLEAAIAIGGGVILARLFLALEA